MPETPHDLGRVEDLLGAVDSVRQVVHAVWALARAQQPSVEAAAAEATAYLDWIDRLVDRVAGPPRPGAPVETLLVVVGPERAFCGAQPRQLAEGLHEHGAAEGALGIVGQRLAEAVESDPRLAPRVRFRVPAAASPGEIGRAAQATAAAVLEHGAERHIELLHPVGGESVLHRSVIAAGRREQVRNPPQTFSPVATVVQAAVGEAVTGRLAVALAEALRAEVRARVLAADAARQACDRRLEELGGDWRVLRQEQITRELIEIVSSRLAGEDQGRL